MPIILAFAIEVSSATTARQWANASPEAHERSERVRVLREKQIRELKLDNK